MRGKHLTLNRCRKGACVRVVSLRCSSDKRKQFCSMGLMPGCKITVLSRNSDGASVIKTGNTNLILDSISGESVLCEEDDFLTLKLGLSNKIINIEQKEDVMSDEIKISDLEIGDSAMITGYEKKPGPYREKILSMGLTKGTRFTLKKKAPMGDPLEIEILGYKLSLRKDEADILKIEKVKGEVLP